jgi:predicted SnoaL-like aldol condensation-catalyzing enzyme
MAAMRTRWLTSCSPTPSFGDDGEHVAIVYDSTMTTKDGTETNVASIEVFHVVEGKVTEVWNCGYKQGVWN